MPAGPQTGQQLPSSLPRVPSHSPRPRHSDSSTELGGAPWKLLAAPAHPPSSRMRPSAPQALLCLKMTSLRSGLEASLWASLAPLKRNNGVGGARRNREKQKQRRRLFFVLPGTAHLGKLGLSGNRRAASGRESRADGGRRDGFKVETRRLPQTPARRLSSLQFAPRQPVVHVWLVTLGRSSVLSWPAVPANQPPSTAKFAAGPAWCYRRRPRLGPGTVRFRPRRRSRLTVARSRL